MMTQVNTPMNTGKLDVEFTQFVRVTSGDERITPYPWQFRLLRSIVEHGKWPQAIAAPTGSGKTIVILVHLFLQSLCGAGRIQPLPRRLALLVNRRALVDSQYDEAVRAVSLLADAAENGNERAQGWIDGLLNRGMLITDPDARIHREYHQLLDEAVQVVNLRGGQTHHAVLTTDWRVHPERVSIMCMTPEMFGSRLLFRGYGVSRRSRSIEAGLLAYDTVAVVDEAHLSRQLLLTAQQVPRIEQTAQTHLSVPVLQTVLSTATPSWEDDEAALSLAEKSGQIVRVTEDDLQHDERLNARLCTPKPVTIIPIPEPLKNHKSIDVLVNDAIQMHEEVGGTVGIIVNSVQAAITVASQLRKRVTLPDSDISQEDNIVVIVGRMRGLDRETLFAKHPGLFHFQGDESIQFVIGTQTLEVGLDMGFAGLITEIAPAAALAQRAGRVNRFAKYASGPIHVLIPPEKVLEKASGVYSSGDLLLAHKWIESLPESQGMTPWAVSQYAPEPETPKRLIFQRIEYWDIENLAQCGDGLAAEERIGTNGPAGIALWIDDDLSISSDVFIVVRHMAHPDQLEEQLLQLTPPLEEEKEPIPIRQAYQLRNTLSEQGGRAFLFHAGDDGPQVQPFVANTSISPGDVLILDESLKLFTDGVFDVSGTEQLSDIYDSVLAKRNNTGGIPQTWGIRLMVSSEESGIEAGPGVRRDDLIELAEALWIQQSLTGSTDKNSRNDESLKILQNWLLAHPLGQSSTVQSASYRLTGTTLCDLRILAGREQLDEVFERGLTVDLISDGDFSDLFSIVIAGASSLSAMQLQTMTFRKEPVLLSDHENDVASIADALSEACGIPDFSDVLCVAGRYHDEGKRDERFQQILRYKDPGLVRHEKYVGTHSILAKSRSGSKRGELAYRAQLGLRGWRHEQLSAVIAWAQDAHTHVNRDLITRLVGTTHGHGRYLFPHGARTLLAGHGDLHLNIDDELLVSAAKALFDTGEWDALIDRTNHQYGFWGMSYLEALLRAADVWVSQQGGVLDVEHSSLRSHRNFTREGNER